MSQERNGQLAERLKLIIERLDETGRNHYMLRNFDDYLFTRRHLDRLAAMLDRLLPHCGPDTRMADLGSNIVFPYLVKLYSEVRSCDGIARTLKRSERFVFRDDGTTSIEPLPHPYAETDGTNGTDGISVPLIHCDLSRDSLPYEDESLDLLTCYETLEHLRFDPMNLMAEANRVLKPNGLFMLTTPNANSISNLKRMVRYESPTFYPPYIRNMDFIEHVKEYSVKEIRLLFESAGFEIETLETFDHVVAESFNHYEAYQIDYIGADGDSLQSLRERDRALERSLLRLLEQEEPEESANRFRGDYILAFARKATEVKDRYCFPVYERFEL